VPTDAKRVKRPRLTRYEASDTFPVKPAVQPEATKRAEKRAVAHGAAGSWLLNPYLSFALLCGIGVTTLRLDRSLRLTLLWSVLLAMVLLHAESRRLKANYNLLNLVRGALVGAVVALPFYIFAKDFFYATASRLYGVSDLQVLLERAVFLVPILEESYFRGVVQREKGLLHGALFFGLAQMLYFIPLASAFSLVLGAVTVGMAMFGLLYGYLYQRYGLTASIACHVAVNFVLLVLPPLAGRIGALLA
jgi:membrane protease YdiL (CAAX protease family)